MIVRSFQGRSLVSLANAQVRMAFAASLCGVEVPGDITGKSVKVHCPFFTNHSDYGMSAALRIYPDSNSGYCFACQSYYSPVKIYAQFTDKTYDEAAADLLDRTGYKPLDYAHLWDQVQEAAQEIDRASLGEALKVWCGANVPDFEARQFYGLVQLLLGRCLDLLDRVQTEEDAARWLAACKTAMQKLE